MDPETAICAFATAGHVLPKEAMRWSLDHWEEAAPALLGLLERYADGSDRSDDASAAVFYVIHLAGERRETRAFAPLCRLARDADALEKALGDGVHSTFERILVGTYDGDLDTLKGLIEAPAGNEYARAFALRVLADLAASGRIDRDAAEAYLLRLYDTMQPQHANYAWVGWVEAVALLGLESFSRLVRRAFARGLIDRTIMGYEHFEEDLQRAVAARKAGDVAPATAPLDDAIGELSRRSAFSEQAMRDRERRAAAPTAPLSFRATPAVNPHKGVGRNDPCPCGSGKKFKKCCGR
jgi:uncharacterized protein